MERGRKRDPGSPTAPMAPAPVAMLNKDKEGSVMVFDQMEREQEGIVNKLHREIHHLREGRSRSRSRSRSSSVSSQTARPAMAPRGSVGENDAILSLRRENELLRRKVTDLTVKLAERDIENERLRGGAKAHDGDIARRPSVGSRAPGAGGAAGTAPAARE